MIYAVGVVSSSREAELKASSSIAQALSSVGYSVVLVSSNGEYAELRGAPLMEVTCARGATFVKANWHVRVEDLQKIMPTEGCIAIVNGFRSRDYIVAAIRSEDLKLCGEKCIAVVPLSREVEEEVRSRGLRLMSVDEVASELLRRALRELLRELPGLNCGDCGYSSCEQMASMVLKGLESLSKCSKRSIPVKLEVDGVEVKLNPFTTRMFAEVLRGLIAILKGVPKKSCRVKLEVHFEELNPAS